MDRYKLDHYSKRIKQNSAIKTFCISKILQHDPAIGYNADQLQSLNYEDLLELAIAAVNKDINITLGAGKDFDNGFDAKASIVRLNSRGKSYSGGVKCKHKKACYVMLYENYHDKFYFFAIPTEGCLEVDLPFSLSGHPKRKNKWWRYECDTFEEMCGIKTNWIMPEGDENIAIFEKLFLDLAA
tara:strand:+ start:107 stop:658 length:552 start_codon:yes stop_codon:yes gene_type:complete